jgi:hypothetical protein
VNWHGAVAIFAVVLLVSGIAGFFRAKRNAEKAATRRTENEKLKHDAMIREENRQSAYAGREVIRPPGSPIGVAVKKRKAKTP